MAAFYSENYFVRLFFCAPVCYAYKESRIQKERLQVALLTLWRKMWFRHIVQR